MSLMEKIFGDLNEKEVKKVSKIADKVMAYDEEYQKLTDQELRDKTQEFKKRIQEGETLDALLPEAFAGGEVTAAAPAISFYALCAADPAAWMAADAVLMIPFLRDIMRKWQ